MWLMKFATATMNALISPLAKGRFSNVATISWQIGSIKEGLMYMFSVELKW